MSFDIKGWSARRERELGLARFYVYEKTNGLWRLDMIAVPKGRQGEGIGSSVMKELVDLADTHGKTIVLQTGERDDRWGTTSKARLERFYRRFGFVSNKGAKKDFLISESMYRRPRLARNPKRKTTWYHGERVSRSRFDDQVWDRDRTTSSLNAEGPGLYWTSKRAEAANYGPFVLEMELPSSFRLMPRKRPTLKQLRDVYELADPYRQELFRDNWGEGVSAADALKRYVHSDTLHDALVNLYGDLFQHDAGEWIYAVRSLGYDGVIVGRPYDVEHLIVWNPDALRNVRESTRDDDAELNPDARKRRLMR